MGTSAAIVDATLVELSNPSEETPATLTAEKDITQTAPDYATRILSLLDAAVNMARQEQPKLLILVGQHEGAYWVMRWAEKQETPTTNAILMLYARQPQAITPSLDELVGRSSLPIIDYVSKYQHNAIQAARSRINTSKSNPNNRYTQIQLQEPTQVLQHDELKRRVKGWLFHFDINQ